MICTGQIEGRRAENGFSALELIVVITVIALLSAIAAISYYNIQERARAENCQANMQIIEDAKTRWLKDHFGEGDPTQSDLASRMMNKQFPVCPDQGAYSGFGIYESVQCSVHGKYRPPTP